MKRPLLLVCLFVILLRAAGLFFGAESLEGTIPEVAEKEELLISAKVSYKDSKKIFLSSIEILNRAADQRTKFPKHIKMILNYEDAEGGHDVKTGQRVVVSGIFSLFSTATNPGETDMKKYYETLKICGRLQKAKICGKGGRYDCIGECMYALRMRCMDRIYTVYPQKDASVLTALLIGDRADLDEEIKGLYQRNGIIHILSISGLHVTVIGCGFFFLLRKAGMMPRPAAAAGAAALIFYGLFVGMGVTVCRAVGMYFLKLLSLFTGKTYDTPTAMGLFAALLVCANPYYLRNAGFLLSFGAVCGVGIVYPVLFGAGAGTFGRENGENAGLIRKLVRRAADWSKQTIFISLSVTAVTLPVMLHFYYEIPVFSALLNILVLPFMSLLLVTGLLVALVPGTGLIGTADCLILSFYEKLCRIFDKIPLQVWNPGCPGEERVVLYYLLLALGLLAIVSVNNKKKGELHTRVIRFAPVLLLTVLVITIGAPKRHGLEVYFLDVGQGDGIVLRTPHNRVYLFDFGSSSRKEVGNYVLKPFLKYKGIGRIDVITVSHPDSDHVNGVVELLEHAEEWKLEIGQIFVTKEGMEFLKGCPTECKEKSLLISGGMGWNDDGVHFVCLNPSDGVVYSTENAASACYLVEQDGKSFLFTGDVEKEGERHLMENLKRLGFGEMGGLRADVLKVAHHGSKYATNTDFLKLTEPVNAVISCGRKNRYGHPHAETLERLQECSVKLFCTNVQGAVTLELRKGNIRIRGYLGSQYGED